MSGLVITIEGTDVSALNLVKEEEGNPEIEAFVNARGVMRVLLSDRSGGSYRPDYGDTVDVSLDSVPIFGGIVQTVEETEQGAGKLRLINVTATDYSVYLDNALINQPIGTDGSTLRDVVDGLITQINAETGGGITRDPSMVAGPVIDSQGFTWVTGREAFNQLSSLTGYSWRMDGPTKVVYFALPAAMDAPFGLDASNVFNDTITVRRDGGQYANFVWLQFGSNGPREVTRTLHGDGSTRLFPLGYVVAVAPTSLTINGTPYPVGIYGVDGPPAYYYTYREVDPTFPYSIIQDVLAPAPMPLSLSDTMVVTFTAQFPGFVSAADGGEISARGARIIKEQNEDIYDVDVATATAQGILRRRIATLAKEVTARTIEPGLVPLMSTTVDWPRLDLSGDFMVTESRLRRVTSASGPVGGEFWGFEHKLIEGNEFQGNWIDYFLNLEGSGSGSGGFGAIVTGGVTPTAIAYADWGGSRSRGIAGTTSWVDVREWRTIVLSAPARVNVRVDRMTQDSSVSVKARIYDYTAGAAAVTGTTTTSTSWDEEILSFDGEAGHRYRLQVQPGSSSNDHEVFAVGVGA